MYDQKLRQFEELSYSEQIDGICEALVKAGFGVEEVGCKKESTNVTYVKDDCDLVLTVINIPSRGLKQVAIYDKCVYDKEIRGTLRKLTLKDRNNEECVPYIASGGINIYLHRLVMGVASKDVQVDHITHCMGICTKDTLRECNAQQNKFNTAYYATIDKENMRFAVPCKNLSASERSAYKLKGYSIKNNRITSPSFNSYSELYKAVRDYEESYLKEFRYKPLYDFSATFYAFVAWRMLGWYTEAEIMEYNRDFILRYCPNLAEYYMLGEGA